MIELKEIQREYLLGKTTVHALRGVNLTVSPGEFMVIIGPSGSGKTTLLNILGCLDRASSGKYTFEGEDISNKDFNDLAPLRNSKIGFIFQSFNLIPVLNVYENIELPCLIKKEKISPAQLREKIIAIANDVGLGAFLNHKPDELSGGQRQRVAIARALITEPHLVLADEPTANLDSKTSQQILELMLRLNKERQVTFLFATHDPQVMALSRRTLRIKDGLLLEGAEDSLVPSH
jgi:putative ABC transport system ATP-binding protein